MTLHRHPDSPLLDHCPASLPARAYTDADWFARERRLIWGREWVCAGRLDDLAPGTMRRVAVAGQSLILCRDGDGRVSAFHNTCRHRGAELCSATEAPLGRLIRCPYHGWSYDTDGRLVSVAHATPTADFVKGDHGLFPVHVHHWNGFLFLCLADRPADFRPDLGSEALANWPMADLVSGHVMETDIACNWKIFWENYNECLHCPGIHPELCDMVPVYRQGIMAANEAPGWTPGAPAAPPLRQGARSWTMTGAPAGLEFPGLSGAERAAGFTFVTLYPTIYIVAHVDHVRTVSLIPLGPEQTRLRAEWLFLPETLAQPGFDLAHVTDFATLVMQQDAAACEMNQRGLKSERYQAGRLMPQEFDIHRFHQWLLARLDVAAEPEDRHE